MRSKSILSLSLIGWLIGTPIAAQVTLDGTLGKSGTLSGPDYQIGANLGQQHGGNLFHSFRDFNLQSHESATFSGPPTVQNIISRVTGGNPSNIDGTVRSTIPNADMYFLNPAGIMFGPNAKLDVQGSFHASTADYLRLQDGGRFEARTPENSLLTVAPVAAFGFLTDSPAAIKTQDSQLAVPKGQTFSLIGGGLEFNGSTLLTYDKDGYAISNSGLIAESGRLKLASVASQGEVIPTSGGLDLTTSIKGGHLTVTNTRLSTSGEDGGGSIVIRGGRFEMTNSQIENITVNQAAEDIDIQVENLTLEGGTGIDSDNLGTGSGGAINLQVTNQLTMKGTNNNGLGPMLSASSGGTMPQAGPAGDITIQARDMTLADGAQLNSLTSGTGQGGTVHLRVPGTLTITGHNDIFLSGIFASSQNSDLEKAGNAGNILIEAGDVKLANGAQISSGTFGTGQGGTIHLQVSGTLMASGTASNNIYNSGIYVSSANQKKEKGGNAGNVILQAREVELADGAQIVSGTFGTGQGGTIHLQVAETLTISGESAKGYHSGVLASSQNNQLVKAGAAGNIDIKARQVVIRKGGVISSTTSSTGQGGTIHLQAAETLIISGQDTKGIPSALAASSVNAEDMRVGAGSLQEGLQAGDAGSLLIQANTVKLLNGGKISTQTNNAGGGNITLLSPNLLYLENSQLITSVKGGNGNGGNITISSPSFVILAKAKMVAQANEGHGGDILIWVNQFIATPPPSSLVNASSRKGISGQVMITSPDPNISSKLIVVKRSSLDAVSYLQIPCRHIKTLEEIEHSRFRFYVYPLMGSRLSPDDWQPSLLLPRSPPLWPSNKLSTSPTRGPQQDYVAPKLWTQRMMMVECLKEEKMKVKVVRSR